MKKILFVMLIAVFVIGIGAEVASAQTGYGGSRPRGGGLFVRPQFQAGNTQVNFNVTNSGQVLGASNFFFATDLSFGMTSQEVVELQERLRSEGFFTFPTSTGYFGPITRAAVQAYQTSHGIPSTGYVGPLTRGALNSSGQ